MTFSELGRDQLFRHRKLGIMRKISNKRKIRKYSNDSNLIVVTGVATKLESSKHNQNFLIQDDTIVEYI